MSILYFFLVISLSGFVFKVLASERVECAISFSTLGKTLCKIGYYFFLNCLKNSQVKSSVFRVFVITKFYIMNSISLIDTGFHFLVLLESVLVNYMIYGICSFHVNHQLFWNQAVHRILSVLVNKRSQVILCLFMRMIISLFLDQSYYGVTNFIKIFKMPTFGFIDILYFYLFQILFLLSFLLFAYC